MTAATLTALGDPTRQAIVDRLRRAPAPVGVIAAELPISRPAVSQHLRVLEGAGLVRCRTDGRRHVYSLDPGGLEGVRRYVEELWEGALAALAAEAERIDTSGGGTR